MTVESEGESTEAQKENEKNSDFSRLSRRNTIASLVGISGLGVLGASRRAAGSSNPGPRPWKQDVDAQGNDLFNLGSLTTAANSKAITDFEGRNLAIDDGVLTATGNSPWEDTDEDGQLEAPNYDGISVEETTTGQVTVGDGSPVTGVWGDSGELVPLSEYSRRAFRATGNTTYEGPVTEITVPFASLSFTNIEQVYVSLIGTLENSEAGGTSFARIYDQTADTPLTNSEVQFTAASDGERMPVDGPKVRYNSEKATLFSVQVKSDTLGATASITGPTIQVWGEIA